MRRVAAYGARALLIGGIIAGHTAGFAVGLNVALFVVWALSLLVLFAVVTGSVPHGKVTRFSVAMNAALALTLAGYGHFVTAAVFATAMLLACALIKENEEAA